MRQRDLPHHFRAALTRVHNFTSRYERNFGVKVVKFGTKVPTSRCRQWSFTTPSHVEIMKTFKLVWRLALIWYSAGSAWSAVANVSVVGPLRLTSTRTKSEVLETGESSQWAVEWKNPDGCYTEKAKLLHKDTSGQEIEVKPNISLKTCNFVKGIVQ